MTTQTYSTKSNAHRAAVKAGLEPEAFETFRAEDGRWGCRARQGDDAVLEAMIEDRVTHGDPTAYEAYLAAVEADAPRFGDADEATSPAGWRAPEDLRDEAEAVDAAKAAGMDPVEFADLAADEEQSPEAIARRQEGRSAGGVPAWYRAGRRFILCIEGDDFPQSAAWTWAMEFAKRTQRTVVVRDADTFERLADYDKNALRSAKGRAPKSDGSRAPVGGGKRSAPTEYQSAMIKAACAPQGATAAELSAATGRKSAPWGFNLGGCQRFGYSFDTLRRNDGAGPLAYRLTRVGGAQG